MSSGTLYLVCAVLGAFNTVNAWHPFARDGRLSLLWYVAGMLTSELPLHTVLWQAAATGGFAMAGALQSSVGVAGLVVSVLSWTALVGLHLEAQRAGQVLDRSLREGLGDGAASQADSTPMSFRQRAMPDRGDRSFLHSKDLSYGDQGAHHLLDIWRRPDLPADAAAPVLLQVHGGAWVTGAKEYDARPLLTHLAKRGWVCVSVNYRLSPAATWPDQVVDVKRALAWVHANIAAHGGDPSFVAVTGGSAGGHLSALAALTPNDPHVQPGFEDADTSVQAAVPVYGLYDLTNRSGGTRTDTLEFLEKKVFKSRRDKDWEAASPICRTTPDAPPFFVVHGENDSFLPVEQARAFVAQLRATSTGSVVYAELPRTQHGFDVLSSVRVHHLVHAVERFLTHAHAMQVGERS